MTPRARASASLQTQDVLANPVVFWRLAEAFGRTGIQTVASTAAMLDEVAEGRAVLGYNVLGSYAMTRAAQDSRLGVVYPRDYALVERVVSSRASACVQCRAAVARLPHLAARPAPALEKPRRCVPMFPADEARTGAASPIWPIPIGAGLLTHLDQKKGHFLRQWRETIAPPVP